MKKNLTMKELPISERPYEKCRDLGPKYLSDRELLALVLQSGTKGKTALDIAEELLVQFRDKGLAGICLATEKELREVAGIGPVKALQLRAVGELSRRIAKSTALDSVFLRDPSSIAEYFMEDMRHLEREEVIAAFFNTKGRITGSRLISVGTVNASLVSPREVFSEALKNGAVYLVLLHNHPSGDPTPSGEDIDLTERLRQAGDMMGVPLYDHIIIGDHVYLSFHERGYFE